MGARRKLFELINGKLPSWSMARLRYEGNVRVLDTQLGGTARFAKKLGHPIPVWLPDTATVLTSAVTSTQRSLRVVANTWIKPNTRLRLDQRYDVSVDDVSDDGTVIHLRTQLGASFDSGTEVSVLYQPITVSGYYDSPVTTFVVHSMYDMYIGDVVVIDGFHEAEVTSALYAGLTPDGLKIYSITVGQLLLSFEDGQEIGLRAYPAYASPNMLVPKQPFVLDRVSGVFYEDMSDIYEVDTVHLRDDASDSMMTLSNTKNQPVYRTGLPVDALLFGKRMEGTVRWDSVLQATVLIPDSRWGRAHLHYAFMPTWEPGQISSWTLFVESTKDAKISIEMDPAAKILVTMVAGGSYAIQIPHTDSVKQIDIRVFADDPETQVRLRSWSLTSDMACRIVSHSTVAHVSGPISWGSTGLLVKRGLRLSDVTARADLGGALSAGFLVS